MLGSATLDVVIGLIFVFLLYSLLATIIQEIVATWMGMRARTLEKAIIRMLNDGNDGLAKGRGILGTLSWVLKFLFNIGWNRFKNFFFIRPGNYEGSLADKFYNHPSIKFLAEDSWHSKPDYIGAKNFSNGVVNILRGDDMSPGDDSMARIKSILFPATDEAKKTLSSLNIEDDTLRQIKSLFMDAKDDVAVFRAGLENWFEETMQRATGWYKRHIQIVLFFIGFFLAIFFNINTLEIVGTLSKDKNAREQLVRLAAESDKYKVIVNQIDTARRKGEVIVFSNDSSAENKLDSVYDLVKSDLQQSSNVLGLGWKVPVYKDSTYCNQVFKGNKRRMDNCRTCMRDFSCEDGMLLSRWDKVCFILKTQISFRMFVGWLIAALAISLGAPFWFDLLSKFMKLRGAGKKDDEKK